MNQDELIEKCLLTNEEIAKAVENLSPLQRHTRTSRLLEAQLHKAIPIIQKAERVRWLKELEAIERDPYDVKDFTRRVCDLIVEKKQSLKGDLL